ncbi:MAG TPA: hypothetical protein PLE85_00755 [Bacteroidales bacterium]|nr:hypothetical protein [Bacteroidales bacterium]
MTEEPRKVKTSRWSLFFIGLSLGIVLGGGVMWWAENYLRTSQQITLYQYNIPDTLAEDKVASDLGSRPQADLGGPGSGDVELLNEFFSDTISGTDPLTETEVDASDTLSALYFTPEIQDPETDADKDRQWTSRYDTTRWAYSRETRRNAVTTDAPVLRDELLYVRQMMVMEEISDPEGNRSRKPVSNKPVRVEFWRSPINYTGYRMSENKLVLFGIFAIDSVMLIKRDDTMWLTMMDDVYPISETYDFKPLVNTRISKPRPVPRNQSRP